MRASIARHIPRVSAALGSLVFLSFACSGGDVDDGGSGGAGSAQAGSSPTGGTGALPGAGGNSTAGSATGQAGAAGAQASGGFAAAGAAAAGASSGGTSAGTSSGGTNQGSAGRGGGAGSAGSAGSSGGAACDNDDDLRCGSACVDPQTDEQHCGGCGKACTGGKQCDDGECVCADGRTSCGSACVDTDSDEQNCGSCGNKCASGSTCEDGKCSGGSTGGTTCSSISDYGVVNSTIVVENGQTYDGQCKRYRASSSLGDGSQDEGQKPVFVLEDGARLVNVVLGAPAADGIHTKGDVTLENITWEDIGEDALTIKESGTVILNGGSAKNGADKVFQINAASTFRVSNFKASNAGKFIRQNGGSDFKAAVFIDGCDISDMDEAIFRTDSSSSTVSMTNTRYHAIGDALFIGVSAGNITQSGNTQY